MATRSRPRSWPADSLLVFLLLAWVYAYFQHDSGWNGSSRYGQILAVVHQHTLRIDSFHAWPPTETSDKAEYDGHYYSDKSIGVALLGVIVYAPIYVVGQALHLDLRVGTIRCLITFLVIGIPSAVAGTLFYRLGLRAGAGPGRALLVTACYAFGTMALSYSALLMGHQLAASFLFIAFVLASDARQAAHAATGRFSFLFGLILGMAVVAEYTAFLVAAPLAVAFAWRHAIARPVRSRLTLLFAAAGGAIPVGLQLANNWACFGSPFRNAYLYHAVPSFQTAIHTGFMGISWPQPSVLFYLTLHPARGIFWLSSVLLAACAGIVTMARDRAWRWEASLVAYAVVSYLLMNAGYFCWWGSWTFGPRFLVPMMPLLCVPLFFVPRRHTWVVAALGAISIAQMIVFTAQEPLVPADFSHIAEQPLFARVEILRSLAALAADGWSPNIGREMGLAGAASLIPLVVVSAILSVLIIREGRREGHRVDGLIPKSQA